MPNIKKVTVEKVDFRRDYSPPGKSFKIYYFDATVKDETGNTLHAEFSTSKETQTKFLIGNTYEVEIITKTRRGQDYDFMDYSNAEKEKAKVNSSNRSGSSKTKGYVRPYTEIISIISQSSMNTALHIIDKVGPDNFVEPKQVGILAKSIFKKIYVESGLNSNECKSELKSAMIEANRKSIVWQKAFSITADCLSWPNFMPADEGENNTKRIFRIAALFFDEINAMKDEL